MFRTSRSSLYRCVKVQVTSDMQRIVDSESACVNETSTYSAGAIETPVASNDRVTHVYTSVASTSAAGSAVVQDPENNTSTARDNCEADDTWWCSKSEDSSDCDNQMESDPEYMFNSEAANTGIRGQLAEWAVKYNVTLTALAALLLILKPYFTFLPSDPRTLLKTPTDHVVKSLKRGGEYCYLGVATGLQKLLRTIGTALRDSVKIFELQFNIDGLPLFKSSCTQLWPILCLVKNLRMTGPFVVSLYCGTEKPGSASEYLEDFIYEMNELLGNGLLFDNKHFGVKIHSFVCDAPAHAFLKGVKGHSGYSSCEKCTDCGEYNGKIIFTSVSCPLRTDESFAQMSNSDHHVLPNPLKRLTVGCVTQFGLDYMHVVCLGVMRCLMYWKGPVGPLQVRLGRKTIEELSQRLVSLTAFIPSVFARRPRSVNELLRWKATEFCLFLLYCGPVVLNGILPTDLYYHFLHLFCAITILASPSFAVLYADFANDLLIKFVKDARALYGKEILVYNTHRLIHLAADVKRLGHLDEFSSFPFKLSVNCEIFVIIGILRFQNDLACVLCQRCLCSHTVTKLAVTAELLVNFLV